MRGIRLIELLAEIRANIVAFLSVAMFVCLGVGLFLGIQWGAVALRNAVQRSAEKGNMHDIEASFPYGITDDDIARIRALDGVSDVEPEYSAFVSMVDGSNSYTLGIHSLTERINEPTSVQGNLPMEHDEIALLKCWAEKKGIMIGDEITLKHDATSAELDNEGTSDNSSGMQYLKSDTFTVTALIETPYALSKQSTALGVSNTTAGTIDCLGFVTKDSFDASKFNNGYPRVFITCDALKGLNALEKPYQDAVAPIVDELTELGAKLGDARYRTVYDEAKGKLDDVKAKVSDGEQRLADGQKAIEDGERQLSDGERRLEDSERQYADGKDLAAAKQIEGTQQLANAYHRLVEGQAKYDAGMEMYNNGLDAYGQLSSAFESVRPVYDILMAAFDRLDANAQILRDDRDAYASALDAFRASQGDEDWQRVAEAYNTFAQDARMLIDSHNTLATNLDTISGVLDFGGADGELSDSFGTVTQEGAEEGLALMDNTVAAIDSLIDKVANASITMSGIDIPLVDIPGGLEAMASQLESSKAELDDAKAQLDAGWSDYNRGRGEYDSQVASGTAELEAGRRQIEEGKSTLADKANELEQGRKTLEDQTGELDEGRRKLADGEKALDKLERYEWVVSPRQQNPGMVAVDLVCQIQENVRWAMALLFIVVGLFVCYSSISRLVYEEITQIGAKKALGFTEGEVAFNYLAFSGLSVALGLIASVALAAFLVQGVMNPTVAKQFALPPYDAVVVLPEVLVMGAIELVLILLSTWIAVHGLLKREALDLLSGESTGSVKERFYERTRLWSRMSLYSQTIVNNCVNDKRRVVGTLIGVAGCTMLIVMAVTLWGNVRDSYETQYRTVYGFDSIVYMDEESEEKASGLAMALYNRGITSTPAFMRKLQIRQNDGNRTLAGLMVPTNEESFEKFYKVKSLEGEEARIEDGGLWVSAAYAEHHGAKAGDVITLTEYTGKTHEFTIAGVFEYYLIRNEFVLSPREYREAFGTIPRPNVLLVNSDGADLDRTREALSDEEGYVSMANDKEDSAYLFDEIERPLTIVIAIYLVLSALMAVMVLLNLDIMFIEEKKRELIVLMINGFSIRQAQSYIYRDSIVLTVVGIVIGVVVGSIAGSFTVLELEPATAFFVKDFNWLAAAAGTIGAGVFAAVVLAYALRGIPRFDLTDVNRF